MFTSIGVAIRQLFAAITMLFSALEKGAGALDHLGTWTNETAAAFADNARMDRVANQLELQEKARLRSLEIGVHAVSPVVEDISAKAKKAA